MTDQEDNTESHTGLVIPAQALPDRLLVLPVYERPFFPSQVQPLVVDAEPWGETFQKLQESGQQVLGPVK